MRFFFGRVGLEVAWIYYRPERKYANPISESMPYARQ